MPAGKPLFKFSFSRFQPVTAVLGVAISTLAILASVFAARSAEAPAAETKTPVEQVYTLPSGASLMPQIGPGDQIYALAYSPNGKYLLTGNGDDMKLWDIASGALIRIYTIGFQVSSVAFSPDGSRIAECGQTGGEEPYGKMAIWDLASGKQVTTFTDDDTASPLASVAFSPDGKSVIAGGYDNTIKLFDSRTGKLLRSVEGRDDSEVAFSSDGKSIAGGGNGTTLKLWNAADGKLLKTFTDTNEVGAVAFSPDGHSLVTQSHDRHITLWDIASGKSVRRFSAPATDTVPDVYMSDLAAAQIAFSPDGHSVLSGSNEHGARLWDVATGRLIREFDSQGGYSASVAFSPDGRTVVSNSVGRTGATLWDAMSGQQIRNLRYGRSVFAVAFTGDGQSFVTWSDDNTLRQWDLKQGKLIESHILASQGSVKPLFSPDAHLFLNDTDGNKLTLWDVPTAKQIKIFDDFGGDLDSFAFSSDSQLLAMSGGIHMLAVFDLKSGNLRTVLSRDGETYKPIAISTDNRFLVAGLSDGTFVTFDAKSGKLLKKISLTNNNELYGDVLSVVSPDGRTILMADGSQVTLYNSATGKLAKKLEAPKQTETAFTFSPNGHLVLSGGAGMQLRDVASGKIIQHFTGHAGNVNAVAVSTDNRLVLSGSDDGTARLWDLMSGKLLATIYSSGEDWAVMAPDGRYVGSNDVGKFARIVRGLEVLPMDDFIRLNRRETLADVLTKH